MRRIVLAAILLASAGYADAAPKGANAAPKGANAASKDVNAASKDADAASKDAKTAPKSDGVGLTLDEVRTLTFKDPISTIYVGNPAIADVTMIDARHAFVQGKSYGHTNIVALDKENAQVFNTHVSVSGAQGGGTVTLNRGAQRITLTCAGGRCEPSPTPGDDQKSYESANTQLNNHQSVAHNMAVADSKPAN
jgi:Flp pilus assembly secretin CpaC